MQQPVLNLGTIKIRWLCGGHNQLDGGAMFGAVPKVLWSKQCPVNEENYFDLVNNPLLVQTPDATLFIDSGLGNKLTSKQQQIFRVTRQWNVVEELQQHGLTRKDIDAVLLTHADFDHVGGATMELDGQLEPTFPKARYVLQHNEWEDYCAPNIRAAHTYFPENLAAVKHNGLIDLVQGDVEIVKGVRVRLSGGHTRGHQIIEITGSSGCAVHMGDLFPTHHHANPLWIMGYDNFPLDVIDRKVEYFKEYSDKDCWFTFYHDFALRACRIGADTTITETFA